MYNGPPLDLEDILPLNLELEFLIAVGAGRPKFDSSGSWTIEELVAERIFSVRNDFYDVFGKFTSGEKYLDDLFASLTKGENSGHIERLNAARRNWLSWGKRKVRQDAVDTALNIYGLPSTRGERLPRFLEWGEKLSRGESIGQPPSPTIDLTEKLALMGFRNLREKSHKDTGFHQYLSDGTLKYFSRDMYSEDTGSLYTDLSEEEAIQRLDDDGSSNVILIAGPGGVGKTRLATHICRSSNAELALGLVNPNLTDYSRLYEELAQTDSKINHLALLIDYAENVYSPVPLSDFQETAHRNLDIRVSVVLCSRAASATRVQDVFRDINLVYHVGTLRARNTKTYEEWLVDQILSFFGLKGNETVEAICSGKPILAAFSGYLAEHHPNSFERQFGMPLSDIVDIGKHGSTATADSYSPPIIEEVAFQSWLRRRLKSFEGLGAMGKRRAAELALALPFYGPDDQARIVKDDTGAGDAVLEILEDDGWIDPAINGIKVVAHDTLADGLISEHIFGSGQKERCTKRLRELLRTAADREYFGRALQTLDRVISSENLNQIDAVDLIDGLSQSHANVVQESALDVLRSKLVLPKDVPALLEKVGPFSEGLDNDTQAYAELSQLAVLLRRKRLADFDPDRHPRFFALLKKAASNADARTLANLVIFDPVGHGRTSANFVRRNKSKYDTGFVIQAYLDTDRDPSIIGSDVVVWLGRFGKSRGASFVLSAWFRSMERLLDNGETWNAALRLAEEMREKLEGWCNRYRHDSNASWALQILIEQRGFRAVDHIIEAWVDRHGTSFNAGHVLQKCLRSVNGLDARVVAWAKDWLDSPVARKNLKEASFLFRDLRNCVLKFDAIQFAEFSKQLKDFLSLEGPLHQRRDLCRYWLELGGDPEEVMLTLQKLVQQDVTDPMVRFCFEAWFNSQTKHPHLFQREMELWLNENAGHPKASYVFGFWDDLGLDLASISDELRTWLQQNYEDTQYSRVLSKYMRSNPKSAFAVGISEEHAPFFLEKEDFEVQDCRNIEFILRSPFGQNNESTIGKAAIAASSRYLRQHVDEVGSAFLIALILGRVGNQHWIKTYANDWLSMYPYRHRASLVYQALLSVEEEPESLIEPIRDWFSENPTYGLAGRLLLAWVENGCDQALLRPEAKVWFRVTMHQEEYSDADIVETWYDL